MRRARVSDVEKAGARSSRAGRKEVMDKARMRVMSEPVGKEDTGRRGKEKPKNVPNAQNTTNENVLPRVHSIIPPRVIRRPPMK